MIFDETNRCVSIVDDDDASPGIEDKVRDFSINDKKTEPVEQVKEESKNVKTNDLPKE